MDEAGNVRTRTNRSGGVQVFILKSYFCTATFFSGDIVYGTDHLVFVICVCMQGGISNGEIIYFKVAFKPTATIGVRPAQQTFFASLKQ